MTATDQIPDAVCLAALDLVLKPLGTAMRHYTMPPIRLAAITAMRGVLLAQRDHDVERAREEISVVAALFVTPSTVKETARNVGGMA